MNNRFGFTGKSKIFKKIGNLVDKGIYVFFSAFGTVFLSLGCAFVGSHIISWSDYTTLSGLMHNPWIYIFVGVFLFFFGAIGIYKDQLEMLRKNKKIIKEKNIIAQKNNENLEKIEQLKLKVDRAQEESQLHRAKVSEIHCRLVESWLKGIAKSVELDTYSRVSIYYEDDESFSILARYSQNPSLSRMHKQKFALNQGVISQSWQHGHWVECEAPTYHSGKEGYNSYMRERYEYSENELDSIRMKSCRYFGLAIVDVDEHIGVILFESTKEEHFNDETIKIITDYCEKYQSHLCSFVRNGLNYDKASSKNSYDFKESVEDIVALREILKQEVSK